MTEYSKILLAFISIVLARLTTMFSIQDIQIRCQTGKIKWSLHASERLRKRNISTEDIMLKLDHIINIAKQLMQEVAVIDYKSAA
jgi:hypothetical protein